jgi:hypothetical protein
MKLSTSILTVLLTQASAFSPSPLAASRASLTSVESAVARETETAADPMADVKYETEVNVEQKFKVADIDPKVNDPTIRVQT